MWGAASMVFCIAPAVSIADTVAAVSVAHARGAALLERFNRIDTFSDALAFVDAFALVDSFALMDSFAFSNARGHTGGHARGDP